MCADTYKILGATVFDFRGHGYEGNWRANARTCEVGTKRFANPSAQQWVLPGGDGRGWAQGFPGRDLTFIVGFDVGFMLWLYP